MPSKEMQFASLIWQVRRLFQRMAGESNDMLAAYDITVSQRAVLEFLDHNEPETLANMARAHDVSRQHIQQIVNGLLEKNLVKSVENPAHKRSFLVQRTEQGDRIFSAIKAAETELFKLIVNEFTEDEVTTTMETLKKFNNFLHSDQWSDLKHQQVKKKQ